MPFVLTIFWGVLLLSLSISEAASTGVAGSFSSNSVYSLDSDATDTNAIKTQLIIVGHAKRSKKRMAPKRIQRIRDIYLVWVLLDVKMESVMNLWIMMVSGDSALPVSTEFRVNLILYILQYGIIETSLINS